MMSTRPRQAAGLGVLATAAALTMFFAWHGAAETAVVPFQFPWAISAALAVGLAGMVLGGWSIHLARHEESLTREAMRTVTELIAEGIE